MPPEDGRDTRKRRCPPTPMSSPMIDEVACAGGLVVFKGDVLSSDVAMRNPEIELLWWEGCPSTDKALAELREALHDVGLADAHVELREIRSDEEAAETGFCGSPTIRLDGEIGRASCRERG